MDEKVMKTLEKQNFWLRLSGVCMGGLFLVVLVTALILVPQATAVLTHMSETLDSADVAVTELNKTAEQLAAIDFEGLVDDTQELVTQSSVGITSALGKLDAIDIDGLNKAIADLGAVVAPLAKFFGR